MLTKLTRDLEAYTRATSCHQSHLHCSTSLNVHAIKRSRSQINLICLGHCVAHVLTCPLRMSDWKGDTPGGCEADMPKYSAYSMSSPHWQKYKPCPHHDSLDAKARDRR